MFFESETPCCLCTFQLGLETLNRQLSLAPLGLLSDTGVDPSSVDTDLPTFTSGLNSHPDLTACQVSLAFGSSPENSITVFPNWWVSRL